MTTRGWGRNEQSRLVSAPEYASLNPLRARLDLRNTLLLQPFTSPYSGPWPCFDFSLHAQDCDRWVIVFLFTPTRPILPPNPLVQFFFFPGQPKRLVDGDTFTVPSGSWFRTPHLNTLSPISAPVVTHHNPSENARRPTLDTWCWGWHFRYLIGTCALPPPSGCGILLRRRERLITIA